MVLEHFVDSGEFLLGCVLDVFVEILLLLNAFVVAGEGLCEALERPLKGGDYFLCQMLVHVFVFITGFLLQVHEHLNPLHHSREPLRSLLFLLLMLLIQKLKSIDFLRALNKRSMAV